MPGQTASKTCTTWLSTCPTSPSTRARRTSRSAGWAASRSSTSAPPDAFDPDTGQRYNDVVGLWVPDESDKFARVRDDSSPFFTTPHFDGHLSVLLRASRMGEISYAELAEAVQEAWLCRVFARRRAAWLAQHPPDKVDGSQLASAVLGDVKLSRRRCEAPSWWRSVIAWRRAPGAGREPVPDQPPGLFALAGPSWCRPCDHDPTHDAARRGGGLCPVRLRNADSACAGASGTSSAVICKVSSTATASGAASSRGTTWLQRRPGRRT